METLQILGWIYLGIGLGSIGGVFGLALFQGGRMATLRREIDDLKEEKILLKLQLDKSYRRGKPTPRKRRNWKKKPVKKQIDFLMSDIYYCMNNQDKQDLQLIDYRLDEQDKRVKELHTEFNTKLGDIHTDIKFIKENLFNPESGLWAETKQNTQFRESTSKWRTVIGTGFIGLMGKHLWDMFTK